LANINSGGCQVKKTSVLLLSIAALTLAGCNNKPTTEAPQKPETATPATGQMPPGHPAVSPGSGTDPHAGMKAQVIPAGVGKKGKVTQVLSAPGKTFLEVADEKGQMTWLAMPEVKVSVGSSIKYPESPEMTNFHSKTLNRDFEKISFIPGIRIEK
jgi:hypothetical protein